MSSSPTDMVSSGRRAWLAPALQGCLLLLFLLVVVGTPGVAGGFLECPSNHHPCDCSVVGSIVQALALDCERRGLRDVPNMGVFRDMPINFLNLANNRISTLSEDFLSGLYFQSVGPKQDPMIDLGGNAIIGMPKHAFRGIRANALGLRLNNCSLDIIPRESLRKLENLTFLMLHGNRIQSLPSSVFTGLKKLRHLDLSGNLIRRVSTDVFMGLEESLKELYLNKLGLTKFPVAAIEKLSRLETLEINNNKISRLEDNSFRDFATEGPLTVGLSGNGMDTVSQRALEGMHLVLNKLDLSNNKLRSLHFLNDACHPIFDQKPTIDVRGNPIMCDCLLYGVVSTGRMDFRGTCQAPAKYSGMALRDDFVSAGWNDCQAKVAGTYATCGSSTSRAPLAGVSSAIGPTYCVLLTLGGVLTARLIDHPVRTVL